MRHCWYTNLASQLYQVHIAVAPMSLHLLSWHRAQPADLLCPLASQAHCLMASFAYMITVCALACHITCVCAMSLSTAVPVMPIRCLRPLLRLLASSSASDSLQSAAALLQHLCLIHLYICVLLPYIYTRLLHSLLYCQHLAHCRTSGVLGTVKCKCQLAVCYCAFATLFTACCYLYTSQTACAWSAHLPLPLCRTHWGSRPAGRQWLWFKFLCKPKPHSSSNGLCPDCSTLLC